MKVSMRKENKRERDNESEDKKTTEDEGEE